jgi:uncharacterized protein YgiM (DUF1202 family)
MLIGINVASAQSMYVTPMKGNVNVRTAPATSAAKAGTLTESDLMPLLDEADGWYKIDFNGKEAYVSQSVASICEAIVPSEIFGKDLASSEPWDKIRHQGTIRIDKIDKDHAFIYMEWMRVNLPAESYSYMAELKDGKVLATYGCGIYIDSDRPLNEILEEMSKLDKTIPVGYDEFNNTLYFNGAVFSEYN